MRSLFSTLCMFSLMAVVVAIMCAPRVVVSLSFLSPLLSSSRPKQQSCRQSSRSSQLSVSDQQRRNIFSGIATSSAVVVAGIFQGPTVANAIPMVSVDEFGIILRDSPRSVRVVTFSGPKSENVVVQLVDGTVFGIKDVVESPTDPRSPLKVRAACRENGVATKFTDIEAILSKSTTLPQKKLYTNQRVRDAQLKELERQERIRQDEEARLAQLAQMEKDEEQAGAAVFK